MSSARTSNDLVGDEQAASSDARPGTPRSLLVVVSGPSGAGKTVVVDALCRTRRIRRSVSATTRPRRDGGQDGVAYHFVAIPEFESAVHDGQFAEWARYGDHYYGTLRRTLDGALDAGEDIVLTIDVQGGAQIRARYPQALLVFLVPPDVETLWQRLTERGTESAEACRDRIRRLPDEMRAAAMYDYAIVNDGSVERAASALECIIEAEAYRMTTERGARYARVALLQATVSQG